jgi:hypothetical protein
VAHADGLVGADLAGEDLAGEFTIVGHGGHSEKNVERMPHNDADGGKGQSKWL